MIFIIHAVPKPKGRPRVTRSGHAFTPKATREYEKLIISEWEVQHSQVTPIENPIAVRVIFHMPIPKATSNKARERMAAGLEVPAKSPILTICSRRFWTHSTEKPITMITKSLKFQQKSDIQAIQEQRFSSANWSKVSDKGWTTATRNVREGV